ncbi:MAG: hypothetical protein ACLFOY_04850 [Desulfatibacillaceae bacterium]
MHVLRCAAVLAAVAVAAAALCGAGFAATGDGSAHALFLEANKAYTGGEYARAAGLYEKVIDQGPVGGDVFYNLGNAYLRMEELGRAILNYEKARVLMPRNPDLDYNLRYARDKREDEAAPVESGAGWAFSWLSSATGGEVFWTVAAINLLFFAMLTLRLWVRAEWTFYAFIALAILWCMAVFFGSAKWYLATHDDRGVVVAERIEVRAGPDENDTVLFALHAGSVVRCEGVEGDWRLVRFDQDKRGWTPRSGVEQVRPLFPDQSD